MCNFEPGGFTCEFVNISKQFTVKVQTQILSPQK